MDTEEQNTLLSYPAFRVINRIVFWNKRQVEIKSIFLVGLATILLVFGSFFDDTLLIQGKGIGLLEHPVIWIFILLNVILPFKLIKAVGLLFRFLKKSEMVTTDFNLSIFKIGFRKTISRKTNISIFLYTLFVSLGFTAFVWNSYQNQLPIKHLGFDFWDSGKHLIGYSLTRIYKFYLWVFFLPACTHIQFSITLTFYQLLKKIKKKNSLHLRPYHQDKSGGSGELITIIISPFTPVLLLSGISTLFAFYIHGEVSITPMIGLLILSTIFILCYLLPAISLHNLIKSEKKKKLAEISQKQDFMYATLIDNKSISINTEMLNSLILVSKQMKSISTWPHFNYIISLITIANLASLISIMKSVFPFLHEYLKI